MGKERVAEAICGLVLAGGKSSRFGSDKASAPLAGRPMLQWVVSALETVCESLVIVRARGQVLPELQSSVPVVVVEDRYEAKGPLAGLVTGLAAVAQPLSFAISCDAPLLRPALVTFLAGIAGDHDIVCPYVEGFPQPLAAIYRPATCLPVFRDCVERDQLKITAAFGPLRTSIVREEAIRAIDPDLRSFRNANRPDAIVELERLVSEQ
jgi:molybdopterin-guanine dinucleotide biosynthesis protein A